MYKWRVSGYIAWGQSACCDQWVQVWPAVFFLPSNALGCFGPWPTIKEAIPTLHLVAIVWPSLLPVGQHNAL